MKIKVLKPFTKVQLTDMEKVFAYLATQYFTLFGNDEHFTIDNMDLKILLFGSTDAHITHNSISKEIKEIVRFALYSDMKTGFQLTKKAMTYGVNRYTEDGKLYKRFSKEFVEITEPKAILIYTYLMGALAHQEHKTFESEDNFGHSPIDIEYYNDPKEAARLQRKIDPLEFIHLLRVTQLD